MIVDGELLPETLVENFTAGAQAYKQRLEKAKNPGAPDYEPVNYFVELNNFLTRVKNLSLEPRMEPYVQVLGALYRDLCQQMSSLGEPLSEVYRPS